MNVMNACETRQAFSFSHGSQVRPWQLFCVQQALALSAALPREHTLDVPEHGVTCGGYVGPCSLAWPEDSFVYSCHSYRQLGQRPRCRFAISRRGFGAVATFSTCPSWCSIPGRSRLTVWDSTDTTVVGLLMLLMALGSGCPVKKALLR